MVEADLRCQQTSKMPTPPVVGPNMNIHEDQCLHQSQCRVQAYHYVDGTAVIMPACEHHVHRLSYPIVGHGTWTWRPLNLEVKKHETL